VWSICEFRILVDRWVNWSATTIPHLPSSKNGPGQMRRQQQRLTAARGGEISPRGERNQHTSASENHQQSSIRSNGRSSYLPQQPSQPQTLVLGIFWKKAGTKNGGKPGKVLFNLKLASSSQSNLTNRENKGARKYVALNQQNHPQSPPSFNITTNYMPSNSTTNQPQIQQPNSTQPNAAKKEQHHLLRLHLLAVQ
jgi:hypothetical protein